MKIFIVFALVAIAVQGAPPKPPPPNDLDHVLQVLQEQVQVLNDPSNPAGNQAQLTVEQQELIHALAQNHDQQTRNWLAHLAVEPQNFGHHHEGHFGQADEEVDFEGDDREGDEDEVGEDSEDDDQNESAEEESDPHATSTEENAADR